VPFLNGIASSLCAVEDATTLNDVATLPCEI